MTVPARCPGVLVAALALGAFGCGGNKGVQVEAVVTLDGAPVEGATVKLVPEPGGPGEPASGLTDSRGICRLFTATPGDGVMPGAYKIGVSKTERLAAERPDAGGREAMKKMMMGAGPKRKAARAKKSQGSLLPASYANPGQSGLRSEVPPPGGKIVLDLKKSGHP